MLNYLKYLLVISTAFMACNSFDAKDYEIKAINSFSEANFPQGKNKAHIAVNRREGKLALLYSLNDTVIDVISEIEDEKIKYLNPAITGVKLFGDTIKVWFKSNDFVDIISCKYNKAGLESILMEKYCFKPIIKELLKDGKIVEARKKLSEFALFINSELYTYKLSELYKSAMSDLFEYDDFERMINSLSAVKSTTDNFVLKSELNKYKYKLYEKNRHYLKNGINDSCIYLCKLALGLFADDVFFHLYMSNAFSNIEKTQEANETFKKYKKLIADKENDILGKAPKLECIYTLDELNADSLSIAKLIYFPKHKLIENAKTAYFAMAKTKSLLLFKLNDSLFF